jgi:hypothetical protein
MDDVTARLVVRQGPNPNTEYSLTRSKTIIGRTQDNDIALADSEVSRQHALIIRQEGGFAIEDLGSTNGTFINGLRVTGITPLNYGDTIELGEAIQLVFLSQLVDVQPAPLGSFQAQRTQRLPAVPTVFPFVDDSYSRKSPPQEGHLGAPPRPLASNKRRWILGCGCGFLLAIFLCVVALFSLDAYDGGRLLYCGPIQPLFETLLGPFGFSPACALS